MGLSFERVKKIKEKFQGKYVFQKPWNDYLTWCGISKVEIQDANVPKGEEEDFCIAVGFNEKSPLPSDLKKKFPKKYNGVRVYLIESGEIKLE